MVPSISLRVSCPQNLHCHGYRWSLRFDLPARGDIGPKGKRSAGMDGATNVERSYTSPLGPGGMDRVLIWIPGVWFRLQHQGNICTFIWNIMEVNQFLKYLKIFSVPELHSCHPWNTEVGSSSQSEPRPSFLVSIGKRCSAGLGVMDFPCVREEGMILSCLFFLMGKLRYSDSYSETIQYMLDLLGLTVSVPSSLCIQVPFSCVQTMLHARVSPLDKRWEWLNQQQVDKWCSNESIPFKQIQTL